MGNRKQILFAGIVMIAIAAGCIMFGVALRSMGDASRADVRELQERGTVAIVADARASLLTNRDDHMRRVNRLEVTFPDADGTSHTLATVMPPNLDRFLTGGGPDGWFEEFPGKETIVGSKVRYILGDEPRVQLESELAVSNSTHWEFVDYAGTGMWGIGAVIAVGVTITLAVKLRRGRRTT